MSEQPTPLREQYTRHEVLAAIGDALSARDVKAAASLIHLLALIAPDDATTLHKFIMEAQVEQCGYACDHCQPDAYHQCYLDKGHTGLHTCEEQS